MENSSNRWEESVSALFLDLGAILVPDRDGQTATLLQLIPAQVDERFTVVELGAGGGLLAQAVLEQFPHCHYIALDGSQVMREQMGQRLQAFRDRVSILPFELADTSWRAQLPSSLRCVLSSLCVHHLSDEGKRQLFRDMGAHLESGGALLLADIIKPATSQIAHLFAQQYDEIVRTQSLMLRGDLSGYEQFQQLQWNYFVYGDPDNIDQPSLLSHQLLWLREAGFDPVDCFWMRAGHAVYGGYK